MSFARSFCKQLLHNNKVEVYAAGKQILEWDGKPNFKLGPMKTGYMVFEDTELTDEEKDKAIIDIHNYNKLMELGFCIVTGRVKSGESWMPRQQIFYAILRWSPGLNHKGHFPQDLSGGTVYAQWDTLNGRVRLCGMQVHQSGYGPWEYLSQYFVDKRKRERFKDFFARMPYTKNKAGNPKNDKTQKEHIMLKLQAVWKRQGVIPSEDEGRFVRIRDDDIPVLLLPDGRVVCIPNSAHIPTIGICGKKGSGKSFLMHALCDRIYWQWKDQILIANDKLNQCSSWALPSNSKSFNSILRGINQKPRPLPIVLLAPMSKGYNLERVFHGPEIGQMMAFSFNDLLENYSAFFKGIAGSQMGASLKYFKQIIPSLKECKSKEEVLSVIEEELCNDKTKRNVGDKIYSLFEDIFNWDFLDISSGVPSRWEFNSATKNGETYPFIGLMECGCVPTLISGDVVTKSYYMNYMKWLFDLFFYYQIHQESLGNKRRSWIVVDELGTIYKKGQVSGKTLATESFIRLITEGRQPQIGVMYNLQNYTKLDEEVRSNTGYLFTYIHSSNDEAGAICKDFGLAGFKKDEIKGLVNHKVMGMTNDRSWIIYDGDGNKEEVKGGCFTGHAIPPMSLHHTPGGRN